MRFRTLTLLLLPTFLTACPPSDGGKDEGPEETVDTGNTTTDGDPPVAECDPDANVSAIHSSSDEDGFTCVIEFTYPEGCDDHTVQGVIVEGVPADDGAKMVAPEECGQLKVAYDWPAGTANSDGDYAVSNQGNCLPPEGGDSSSALECNDGEQAASDTWDLYLPAPPNGEDCEDYYDDVELDFIYGDEDCEQTISLREPGCQPSLNVPVDFIYRQVGNLDNDGTQHARLMPILSTAPGFSERAWLRRVKVTDWGDAHNLMALGWGHGFQVSPTDVVDRSTNAELTASMSERTFSPGQVSMNTVWSMDGLPSSQAIYFPPRVEVDWSCEVDANNPHFTVAPSVPSFVASVSALDLPGVQVQHKMVLRFPEPGLATLELAGRSRDAISFAVQPLGGGQGTFDIDRKARGGFHLAGTISGNAQTRHVQFSTLIVRGLNLGTPTLTFTAL